MWVFNTAQLLFFFRIFRIKMILSTFQVFNDENALPLYDFYDFLKKVYGISWPNYDILELFLSFRKKI